MRRFAAFLVASSLAVAAAYAQLGIGAVRWEVPLPPKKRASYRTAKSWHQPPAMELDSWPRAVVHLDNAAARREEAVLLRYSVSARLVRIGVGGAGNWAVPFIVEDKRVPVVGASAKQDITVYPNRVVMATYFKRLYRAGFWPAAIRIQVMVEPRPGDDDHSEVAEAELPLVWSPQPAGGGR